jgi:hypothetical protein
MADKGAHTVVVPLKLTFPDVVHVFYDILKCILFLKGISDLVKSVARYLNSCVVGYSEPEFWIMCDEKGPHELFSHFLVLPPKITVDCKLAKSVIRECISAAENYIRKNNLENLDPEMVHLYLYDIKRLEIWKIRDFYRVKQLSKVLKWLTFRKELRKFVVKGVNIYDVMTRNWRKFEATTLIRS